MHLGLSSVLVVLMFDLMISMRAPLRRLRCAKARIITANIATHRPGTTSLSASIIASIDTSGNNNSERYPEKVVVVVGGGAAGYFSAIECAKDVQERCINAKVHVLEASRSVLSKVLISGGGRCNVMHNPDKTPLDISKGYPRGNRELLGPLTARFGPKETKAWFIDKGVQLKTEKDGRVFPTTDRSSTVADALQTAARAVGVDVQTGTKVVGVEWCSENGRFLVSYQQSASTSSISGVVDTSSAGLKGRRSSLYDGLESTEYMGSISDKRESDPVGIASVDDIQRKILKLECDRVIMASGSSRLGYDIVRGLGHNMKDPLPSLFSFKIKDSALNALSGVSNKNCKVSLVVEQSATELTNSTSHVKKQSKKNKESELLSSGLIQRGPVLITRQGLSGPAVLKLSAFGARVMSAAKYKCKVQVNWLGDLSKADVNTHLLNAKDEHSNKQVSKFFPVLSADMLERVRENFPVGLSASSDQEDLAKYGSLDSSLTNSAVDGDNATGFIKKENEDGGEAFISRRLWVYLLQRAGLGDPQLKWRQLNTQQISALAHEITNCCFEVDGRGLYRDEFVTCGGVELTEVNFKTMESRVRAGLYLTGEVLDVDGITGGYNFQSAWTTGFIAGQSCAASL